MSDLNDVLINGGIIKVKGVTVFVDSPDNLNYYTSASGYHIVSANGYKVYFKCRDRAKAQLVCDEVFGKNQYRVQAKI